MTELSYAILLIASLYVLHVAWERYLFRDHKYYVVYWFKNKDGEGVGSCEIGTKFPIRGHNDIQQMIYSLIEENNFEKAVVINWKKYSQ